TWLDDAYAEEHLGVIKAAVLRAMAGEDACANLSEVEVVRDAGQGIAAEVERRNVEAVHHVSRLEHDLCGLAERQYELGVLRRSRVACEHGRPGLRGLHQRDLLARRVEVTEAPTPLEARDLDRDC